MSEVNFEALRHLALEQIRTTIPDYKEFELDLVCKAMQDTFQRVREKTDRLRGLIIDNLVVDKDINALPDKQLAELERLSAENLVRNLGVKPETASELVRELFGQVAV